MASLVFSLPEHWEHLFWEASLGPEVQSESPLLGVCLSPGPKLCLSQPLISLYPMQRQSRLAVALSIALGASEQFNLTNIDGHFYVQTLSWACRGDQ